jgi:hypothetical protein
MRHDASGNAPRMPARPPGKRARRGRAFLIGLVVVATVGCSAVAASLIRSAGSGAAATTATGNLRGEPTALGGMGSLVSPPPTRSGGPTAPAGSRSDIFGGALFGGDVPLLSQQGTIGRKLAIVRIYDLLGQNFAGAQVRRILASGSTVLVSLDTHPGMASYASIAAGHEDGAISRFLAEVNQAALTYHLGAIYISFEHEVDNTTRHAGLGTPAQFIAAWDHIHALAAAAHLDWTSGGRLHWVWLLEHGAFFTSAASTYWPGSGEVDIVGVDGYNTAGCRLADPGTTFVAAGTQIQTPAYIFGPALRFAQAHGGLPVFVAEFASTPYRSPAVQAGFIGQMQAFVTSHPQIGAAMYWDSRQPGSACNFIIDRSQSSLAALAAMGRAPGLQAVVPRM